MKFIHLSDLHIGIKVNNFSMIEDQKYIFNQILNIIDEQKVEAVLLAGDIYDKTIPSIEAIQMLDELLLQFASRKLPVFMISGNHDCAERLSFGARLIKDHQIYVASVYNGEIETITLKDEHGDLNVTLLPFIKPAHVRKYYPEAKIETYHEAVEHVIKNLAIDSSQRNLIVAHQFVTGAKRCDSEELTIGGIDNIDVSVFDDFDYVALGHIHNPQKLIRETVRYCGTPLKYSFSEADHQKKAIIVNMNEKGNVDIEEFPLVPKHDMRKIKGSYLEITNKNYYQNMKVDDYLHVTLTDEEDVIDAIGKLRTIYPNIMLLDYDNKRTQTYQTVQASSEIETKSPLDLVKELYELQNNQPMNDKMETYCLKLMEKIWEDER